MRKISGYIFIPHFGDFQPLWGAKVSLSKTNGNYDAFESNGFTPFSSRLTAFASAKEFLSKRCCTTVDVASLDLVIAEMPKDIQNKEAEMRELELFKHKSNLVVITYYSPASSDEYGRYEILGPKIEGGHNIGYIGAMYADNGHKTIRKVRGSSWTAFDEACNMRHQAFRQGGASWGTTIAQLHLKTLKTIIKK